MLKQASTAPADITELRQKVQVGLAQLERGEGHVLEGDEAIDRFFDELEAEVDAEMAVR